MGGVLHVIESRELAINDHVQVANQVIKELDFLLSLNIASLLTPQEQRRGRGLFTIITVIIIILVRCWWWWWHVVFVVFLLVIRGRCRQNRDGIDGRCFFLLLLLVLLMMGMVVALRLGG